MVVGVGGVEGEVEQMGEDGGVEEEREDCRGESVGVEGGEEGEDLGRRGRGWGGAGGRGTGGGNNGGRQLASRFVMALVVDGVQPRIRAAVKVDNGFDEQGWVDEERKRSPA